MTGETKRPRVLSIRWIVAAAAVGLTAGLGLAMSTVAERDARRALTIEVEARLLLQSRNLALTSAGALLTDYPELTLVPLVKSMRDRQPELASVVVVDRAGVIQGHSDVRLISTHYTLPRGLREAPASMAADPRERLLVDDEMLLASAPIRHSNGETIGTALVGIRRDYIEQNVRSAVEGGRLVFGILLLLGVVASVVLMSILMRPVARLREGIERIGRGDLNAKVSVGGRTEFRLLADAMNEMTTKLRSAQADLVERERLAHEMNLAKNIQERLLPAGPVSTGSFTVLGGQWAAAEVGGDYYDAFEGRDGTLGLAIADVSGKGLAGCLVTSMLFALLRALRRDFESPAMLLRVLHDRLREGLRTGSFVTMFYGILDSTTGRLTFASAGHNPLLVYRARTGEVEWRRTDGLPLGAVGGPVVPASLRDDAVVLDPGDCAVQYTDGLSEASETSGQEEFGIDRIADIVRVAAPNGARAIVDALHDAAVRWRGDAAPLDDETVLVLYRAPARALLDETESPSDSGANRPGLDAWDLARTGGQCLALPANLDSLPQIEAWLRELGGPREWDDDLIGRLHLGLHEAVSNVIEHGFGPVFEDFVEVWWVPKGGYFLIRDHGVPFDAKDHAQFDPRDPKARKKGRGLGLTIIDRVMERVDYYPGMTVGNITVLHCPAGAGKF
ncbi:MAG TPA: SpoIIE family protein phosphatase [Candidatus Eisenbacteria bacterium]|nr:SpoIIE family protein phosphatase [Candidatus Eisenbacteria bacterium]